MTKHPHPFCSRLLGLLLALLFAAALPLSALAEESSTPNEGEEGTGAPTVSAAAGGMYQPDFDIAAPAAYLVNEESGIVMYAKNEDTPYVAASLVKMMTAILIMESVENLDGTSVLAETWVFDELYGKNASTADILPGETATMRELLYAMLLPSANEAALMAAGHISGGSIENFVYLMNQKAQSLGCTGTTFADPNGLSEGNLTTARDMYLITKEFMRYVALQEIASTHTYAFPAKERHSAEYNIFTTNRLIVPTSPYYTQYSAITGAVRAGKTGSLGEWQNFACLAEQGGMTYYCVVLNSPNAADTLAEQIGSVRYYPAMVETAQLLNWAYTGFAVQASLDTTRALFEVSVRYSTEADAVKVLPSTDLSTILPVEGGEELVTMQESLPEFVEAPVRQGDVLGSVTLYLGGMQIGTADLIAARDVDRNATLYAMAKVKAFFGTWVFKLLVALVLLAGGGYVALLVYANNKKKRKKRP